MGEMSADMLIEEISIALDTGRCPRCGVVMIPLIDEDCWELSCPGCKAVYGGSI